MQVDREPRLHPVSMDSLGLVTLYIKGGMEMASDPHGMASRRTSSSFLDNPLAMSLPSVLCFRTTDLQTNKWNINVVFIQS